MNRIGMVSFRAMMSIFFIHKLPINNACIRSSKLRKLTSKLEIVFGVWALLEVLWWYGLLHWTPRKQCLLYVESAWIFLEKSSCRFEFLSLEDDEDEVTVMKQGCGWVLNEVWKFCDWFRVKTHEWIVSLKFKVIIWNNGGLKWNLEFRVFVSVSRLFNSRLSL